MYSTIEGGGIELDTLGEEVVQGLRKILGPHVSFHYTLRRPDYGNMTYGGLHITREGAEGARAKLAREEPRREWERADMLFLEEGAHYNPWGTLGTPYTHGVNDGTHRSTIRLPSDKYILMP